MKNLTKNASFLFAGIFLLVYVFTSFIFAFYGLVFYGNALTMKTLIFDYLLYYLPLLILGIVLFGRKINSVVSVLLGIVAFSCFMSCLLLIPSFLSSTYSVQAVLFQFISSGIRIGCLFYAFLLLTVFSVVGKKSPKMNGSWILPAIFIGICLFLSIPNFIVNLRWLFRRSLLSFVLNSINLIFLLIALFFTGLAFKKFAVDADMMQNPNGQY